MREISENRLTLTIVILFVTHTLFSAQEFKRRCIENKRFQQSREDKQLKFQDSEQLTVKLQQLVNESCYVWQTNSPIMQELIRKGASPNVKRDYATPLLFFACRMDDIDLVKDCVTHGVSLESANGDGYTALYSCKSLPVLRYLLGARVDPSHQNCWGDTALYSAVTKGLTTEVIEELCRHTVPSHKIGVNTPLHNLCWRGVGSEDFERRVATLLWWSELQLKIEDDRGKLPRDYLSRGKIAFFDAISGDIIRARARFLQQQNKEREELEQIVQQSIPAGIVVKLVSSYVEPSYISLRDFMTSEESKREYPAIAYALLP